MALVTDVDNQVYEKGSETNNSRVLAQQVDIMPIPYADLVVESVVVPAQPQTGQRIQVGWTVLNQGLGLTNVAAWNDVVHLATDPAGENRVAELGQFYHFGQLEHLDAHSGAEARYTRSVAVKLPDGLTPGPYYLVVTTGVFAPLDATLPLDETARRLFEFIHGDNNTRVSSPMDVRLADVPDLAVTEVIAPTSAMEESTIEVSWTVANRGAAAAEGIWQARAAAPAGQDPQSGPVVLGTFERVGPLASGSSYSRSSRCASRRIVGHYQLVVVTNFDGQVYERTATANNEAAAAGQLEVHLKPRPDLQVTQILAPDRVDAGGSFRVDFVVSNLGTRATAAPQWTDRIFLSLDNVVSADDILISQLDNQAALGVNESYRPTSETVIVPERFRGEVFVLVHADTSGQVDEWPNDQNNMTARAVYVEPLPLADLVMGRLDGDGNLVNAVVAPDQAIQGQSITVQYTVTNLGPGNTNTDQWTDTLWLAQDRNRPHPGHGDVLLATVTRPQPPQVLVGTQAATGTTGYDAQVTVTLPTGLESGTYYITPWTDPYEVVREDTLAVYANPDDPNEVNNNNYRARPIQIIGQLPDLVVTSVQVTPDVPSHQGGETITVRWTVENQSSGTARAQDGWIDRVYVSTQSKPFAREPRASCWARHATGDNPCAPAGGRGR